MYYVDQNDFEYFGLIHRYFYYYYCYLLFQTCLLESSSLLDQMQQLQLCEITKCMETKGGMGLEDNSLQFLSEEYQQHIVQYQQSLGHQQTQLYQVALQQVCHTEGNSSWILLDVIVCPIDLLYPVTCTPYMDHQ